MADHNKKEMTKKELWDKLHNERRMWQEKCQYDMEKAVEQAVTSMRLYIDPILAELALEYGEWKEDHYELPFKQPANRDGYYWTAKVSQQDDGMIVWAKEEAYPEQEQETV